MPSWDVTERCQSMKNVFLSVEFMPVCRCLPFQSVSIICAHASSRVSISMPETTESLQGDKQESKGHWCKLAVNIPCLVASTFPFPSYLSPQQQCIFQLWAHFLFSHFRQGESTSVPLLRCAAILLQLITNSAFLSPGKTVFTPPDRQTGQLENTELNKDGQGVDYLRAHSKGSGQTATSVSIG